MSKEYKVIALSVSTKKGLKRAGDTVTENDFPKGHLQIKVDGGFIEAVKGKEKKQTATEKKKAKADADAKDAKK